jgi:hypothetical protein
LIAGMNTKSYIRHSLGIKLVLCYFRNLISDLSFVPQLHPPLPHPLVPFLNIRQPCMWPVWMLLPLWSRRLQSRLLLTFAHQLTNRATAIVSLHVHGLGSVFPHFLAQLGGCAFVDGEIGGTHNDTIVLGGAGDGDEAAVDFLGDDGGGAG